LINYNPDNPFIFSGSGSGNRNITESIAVYDLHFVYSLTTKKEIEEEYQIPTSFLPFGFDIENGIYDTCSLKSEIVKTCFLGNPDKYRASFIHELAMHDIEIDVYGNHWDKFVNHPKISIFPSVIYGPDLWQTLRRYRIQLNLMRIHNMDSHNMRSFEVPAIGGIMLAPDTKEHRMFFENEKEVFLFSDLESCVGQINRLISLNTTLVENIRKNARMRSVNSGYSYRDRAIYALKEIDRFREGSVFQKDKIEAWRNR
jgi:spore maturation protein CgeB